MKPFYYTDVQRTKRSRRHKEYTSKELNEAIKLFLKKGGTITYLEPDPFDFITEVDRIFPHLWPR